MATIERGKNREKKVLSKVISLLFDHLFRYYDGHDIIHVLLNIIPIMLMMNK